VENQESVHAEQPDKRSRRDGVRHGLGEEQAVGATFLEAARLSNYAGGIVVMKRGTATVTAAELEEAVLTDGLSGF
jgi:bifunctional ADP-heptose synthase (sugar kinase/adenylyltransferase)